jgi:opacity protein-like surface antigen
MKLSAVIPFVILLYTLQISLHDAEARQSGGAAVFSEIGHGARGMGMGNAMSATVTEGSYSFYNPAHSGFFSNDDPHLIQADISTSIMSFDRHLHAASVRFPLPPSAGISISMIKAGVTGIDGRSSSGYHTGYLETSEYLISGSFGLRLTPRLTAGLSLNYFLADYHTEIPKTNTVGLNTGILIQITPELKTGLSIHNLLASYRTDSSSLYGTESRSRSENFPKKLIAGVAYLPADQLTLSADYELQRVQNYRPGAPENSHDNYSEENETHHIVRAGTSYRLHERLTLRTGVTWMQNNRYSEAAFQPSAGFSLHLPFDTFSPSVDYAFVQEPSGISAIHNFSLQLRIN